jgi:hypothetical protein
MEKACKTEENEAADLKGEGLLDVILTSVSDIDSAASTDWATPLKVQVVT